MQTCTHQSERGQPNRISYPLAWCDRPPISHCLPTSLFTHIQTSWNSDPNVSSKTLTHRDGAYFLKGGDTDRFWRFWGWPSDEFRIRVAILIEFGTIRVYIGGFAAMWYIRRCVVVVRMLLVGCRRFPIASAQCDLQQRDEEKQA